VDVDTESLKKRSGIEKWKGWARGISLAYDLCKFHVRLAREAGSG
jgi:hypothetical protein